MSWAALLLASALLIGGDSRPRVRAGLTAAEPRRRSTASGASDPLAAASSFDVLAACLRCGMAVSTAASATAPSAPAPLARMLNRAADLLALGCRAGDGVDESPQYTGGPTRLARGPSGQPCRRTVAARPAICIVGSGPGARSCRTGRSLSPRSGRCCERSRRAGLGVDRWAAGPLLSAGVRVFGHRPRRRGLGRRCAGVGNSVTADKK